MITCTCTCTHTVRAFVKWVRSRMSCKLAEARVARRCGLGKNSRHIIIQRRTIDHTTQKTQSGMIIRRSHMIIQRRRHNKLPQHIQSLHCRNNISQETLLCTLAVKVKLHSNSMHASTHIHTHAHAHKYAHIRILMHSYA